MNSTDIDVKFEREWLSVPDIANELDSGERPIYRAIKNNELRAAKINDRGDLRVSRAWLEDWLERRAARG
jgi:excisionase family DNA binding protein